MIYSNWERQAPAELITPQEITDIMQRAGTADDITRAVDVANEYIHRNNAKSLNLNFRYLCRDFQFLCMLSNVYQCGRLQGIREQRAWRRERANA